MYIIICETDRQSRFDAWDRALRAGAFTFKTYLFLCFWLGQVFTAAGISLLVVEWGLLSSCRARASACDSFRCCQAQTLGHTGSVVVAYGFRCFAGCGIFMDQGSSPWLLRWQEDSLPLSHQGFPVLLCFSLMLPVSARVQHHAWYMRDDDCWVSD